MLTVRHATPEDAETIGTMEHAVFSDAWSADMLRGTLRAPYTLALLAEDDGQAVGYLLATVLPPEAELLRIASHPTHRRRGIGRRLLDAFLTESTDAGCEVHLLEVRSQNDPAITLYKAFGFRTDGVRRAYYRHPTDDAVLMRRDVPSTQGR